MARIDTDQTVNPSQLGVELGRVPVRHVAGSYVEADATATELRAALAAHVADPNWVDPSAPPPTPPGPTVLERLTAVEARLDKAANAAVTGEAAKLRDGLKPVT